MWCQARSSSRSQLGGLGLWRGLGSSLPEPLGFRGFVTANYAAAVALTVAHAVATEVTGAPLCRPDPPPGEMAKRVEFFHASMML